MKITICILSICVLCYAVSRLERDVITVDDTLKINRVTGVATVDSVLGKNSGETEIKMCPSSAFTSDSVGFADSARIADTASVAISVLTDVDNTFIPVSNGSSFINSTLKNNMGTTYGYADWYYGYPYAPRLYLSDTIYDMHAYYDLLPAWYLHGPKVTFDNYSTEINDSVEVMEIIYGRNNSIPYSHCKFRMDVRSYSGSVVDSFFIYHTSTKTLKLGGNQLYLKGVTNTSNPDTVLTDSAGYVKKSTGIATKQQISDSLAAHFELREAAGDLDTLRITIGSKTVRLIVDVEE